MRATHLLIISLLSSQVSNAQLGQDTLSNIESTLSKYQSPNPGCQLSISRNGQLIFSKAWGMADLEHKVPLSTHSIIEAGSVSKQFTAASILLLEQQGKLSLDDDVRKYIPELPTYDSPILLRHLLHHTSGIRDWGDIAELTGWPRGKKAYTNEDALDIIVHQKHLNNKPGAEFLYSNSNYSFLAMIVQRVSGMTLAAFTQKYIFEPAGMTHTQWRDDPNRIVIDRAIAYSRSDGAFKTNMPNEYVYGHGALLTTTEDLLKWNIFYQDGRLGNPSLFLKQTTTEPLNNGVMNSYAAGLFIRKVLGWNDIFHDGSTAGYRAYLETFPQLGLSIAILSNNGAVNIVETARNVRKFLVPDHTKSSTSNHTPISPAVPRADLSHLNLDSYEGKYFSDETNSSLSISNHHGKLLLQVKPGTDYPLTPTYKDAFKPDNLDWDLRFIKSPENKTVLKISLSRARDMEFKKIEPYDPHRQVDNRKYL